MAERRKKLAPDVVQSIFLDPCSLKEAADRYGTTRGTAHAIRARIVYRFETWGITPPDRTVKRDPKMVQQATEIFLSEESHGDVALKYGVKYSTVANIRRGSIFRDVTKNLKQPVYKNKRKDPDSVDPEMVRGAFLYEGTLKEAGIKYGKSQTWIYKIRHRLIHRDITRDLECPRSITDTWNLAPEIVKAIFLDTRFLEDVAEEYNTTTNVVDNIRRGITYAKVTAGLEKPTYPDKKYSGGHAPELVEKVFFDPCTHTEASKKYNIPIQTISLIRKGLQYTKITEGWAKQTYRDGRGIRASSDRAEILKSVYLDPCDHEAAAKRYQVSYSIVVSVRMGRYPYLTGSLERPKYARKTKAITAAKRMAIKQVFESPIPGMDAARKFNLTPREVYAIRDGRSYGSVTDGCVRPEKYERGTDNKGDGR